MIGSSVVVCFVVAVVVCSFVNSVIAGSIVVFVIGSSVVLVIFIVVGSIVVVIVVVVDSRIAVVGCVVVIVVVDCLIVVVGSIAVVIVLVIGSCIVVVSVGVIVFVVGSVVVGSVVLCSIVVISVVMGIVVVVVVESVEVVDVVVDVSVVADDSGFESLIVDVVVVVLVESIVVVDKTFTTVVDSGSVVRLADTSSVGVVVVVFWIIGCSVESIVDKVEFDISVVSSSDCIVVAGFGDVVINDVLSIVLISCVVLLSFVVKSVGSDWFVDLSCVDVVGCVNDSVVDLVVLSTSSAIVVVFRGMNVPVVSVCCAVDETGACCVVDVCCWVVNEAVELLEYGAIDDWSVEDGAGVCVDMYGWDEVLVIITVTVDSSGMSFWSSLKYQMNVTPMTIAAVESRIRIHCWNDSRGLTLVSAGKVSLE